MAQTMKDILNRMLNHEELSREEMKNILIGITQSEQTPDCSHVNPVVEFRNFSGQIIHC